MTYKPTPQKVKGGQPEAVTSDADTQQLLQEILRHLRQQTLLLSLIADVELDD